MSRVISQYPIKIQTHQDVHLPVGAEILSVKLHGPIPYLWALIDPNEKLINKRLICIFNTGEAIENFDSFPHTYISTITFPGLVSHVFERCKSPVKATQINHEQNS